MRDKERASREEISELKNPYFDLQAAVGITKHGGGLNATRELIELCHMDNDTYLLDAGCGVGMTACYLAKKIGCKVVGVDIRDEMIARSKERASREGVEGGVEFRVADVQDLPFEDALFDVVISESVTAFPEDKRRAVSEYARVTKPGGYVGLNETTWLKTPTPKEVVEYIFRGTGGCKPETADGWKELLEDAGLRDIVLKTDKIATLSQIGGEIRMMGFAGLKAYGSLLSLYFKSPPHRRAVKELKKGAWHVPKKLLDYFGWDIRWAEVKERRARASCLATFISLYVPKMSLISLMLRRPRPSHSAVRFLVLMPF